MSRAAAGTGHGAGDDRAAELRLPSWSAPPGVLPADGKRRVIVYMHGGAFLTCGVNTHGRLVEALSKFADSPVLVVNYRMIPKHSVGMALDDCYDAYKWLRLKGYDPEQIVLAGDSAGGYLALALAERLQREGLAGETPAAIVTMSPLFEIDNESRANHPNIRSDAMFPPKAFTALVELVEAAAERNVVDGKPEEIFEPLDHIEPGLPRTLIHVSGSEVLLNDARKARAHAGRRGRAGGGAGVARSDARVPDRRARGERGHQVAATGRRLHPRGHLVTVRAA